MKQIMRTIKNKIFHQKALKAGKYERCQFLDCEIENCNLLRCEVDSCNVKKSDLTYCDYNPKCTFDECLKTACLLVERLHIDCSEIKDSSEFLNIESFENMQFKNREFAHAKFTDCEINECILDRCEVEKSYVRGCEIPNSKFSDCCIDNCSDFDETELIDCEVDRLPPAEYLIKKIT